MDLYFSPLACSMATRIALYDAGAQATYYEVDPKSKKTLDGQDFRTINPLALVPVLRTDDGEVLTENAAILQYVAERLPAADLAPASGIERARLQQWLSFIGTELHKGLFAPLFDGKASQEVKAYTLQKAAPRLALLEKHLTDREFLLDRFSVADAYLVTVMGWTLAIPAIDLTPYPALKAYLKRVRARPSVAKAEGEERALYAQEQARHKAA